MMIVGSCSLAFTSYCEEGALVHHTYTVDVMENVDVEHQRTPPLQAGKHTIKRLHSWQRHTDVVQAELSD